jgi:hypothetical protein
MTRERANEVSTDIANYPVDRIGRPYPDFCRFACPGCPVLAGIVRSAIDTSEVSVATAPLDHTNPYTSKDICVAIGGFELPADEGRAGLEEIVVLNSLARRGRYYAGYGEVVIDATRRMGVCTEGLSGKKYRQLETDVAEKVWEAYWESEGLPQRPLYAQFVRNIRASQAAADIILGALPPDGRCPGGLQRMI